MSFEKSAPYFTMLSYSTGLKHGHNLNNWRFKKRTFTEESLLNTSFLTNPSIIPPTFLRNKFHPFMKWESAKLLKSSTQAYFHRTLEQEFGDLLCFITRNDYRVFVYPSTQSVHDLVLEYCKLQSQLETAKASPDKKSIVEKAAVYVREEITFMADNDNAQWAPNTKHAKPTSRTHSWSATGISSNLAVS